MVKQVYDLTVADFDVFPIWEFLSEDDDEAADELSVKGRTLETLGDATYVAKAEFRLANGEVYDGFLSPYDYLGYSQPCVFFSGGPITFWYGAFMPKETDIAHAYSVIGRPPTEVFPITWTCAFSTGTPPKTGRIDGFGYISDDNQDVYLQ